MASTIIPKSDLDRSITDTANKYFRYHMLGESLGHVAGPIFVALFYNIWGAAGTFCSLAIFSFCVWMMCAIVMKMEVEKEQQE